MYNLYFLFCSSCVAHTTEINTSYPNIINQHLVKANWAQAALHNVCNRTRCHNCQKTFETPLYSTVFAENMLYSYIQQLSYYWYDFDTWHSTAVHSMT